MKNDKRHVRLGHHSNERIKRLKRSLNRVHWYRTLVQLFWSAGPVTALGLIGGYYIGYGVLPPVELMLYFISFSVLSGIIGLFVKIGYDTTRGHVEEQDEQTVLKVIDILGDLLLEVGDMQVQAYEGNARRREAALQLLRRIDLTSYGVAIAFSDLTNDADVGRLMARLHAYRRAGLHTRAREIYQTNQEHIEQQIAQLKKQSPQAAEMLEERFKGITTGSFRQGVEREKHFLQRVMSASEQDNPLLMTFRDVEEMIVLTFELICGREIPILTFTYSGRWKFARLLDLLEEKRSKYRISQAKASNRIWALAAYLRETGLIDKNKLPKGLPMQQLTHKVVRILDELSTELRRELSAMDGSSDPEKLARFYEKIRVATGLYEMAYKGNIEIGKRHKQLIEVSAQWDKLMKQSSPESKHALLRLQYGKKRGLSIKENIVLLSEEERIAVCRHLLAYFEQENMADTGNKLSWIHHEDPANYENRTEAARRLALELAVTLEPYAGLSKPEIQRNLNATKATYLGELTPDLTGLQKMEIGKRGAKIATDALDGSAEELAKALVRIYHISLDSEAIDFLHQTYGARKEMLERLAQQGAAREPQYPSSLLSERPPVLPKPKAYWQHVLRNAKKRVDTTPKNVFTP
ncbi:MAG: hypothetical protein ACOC2C_00560 [Cyclonatronaceae bacterium]